MIYNPKAIDYSAGIDITDTITGNIYTYEQAILLPAEIKNRLINKPRKIGCMVMTLEECDECLRKRGLIE